MFSGEGRVMRAIKVSSTNPEISRVRRVVLLRCEHPGYAAGGHAVTARRHIPARAISSTILTICEATAVTARAGPLDLDVAIATVRWNGGSAIFAACRRPSATSL